MSNIQKTFVQILRWCDKSQLLIEMEVAAAHRMIKCLILLKLLILQIWYICRQAYQADMANMADIIDIADRADMADMADIVSCNVQNA